MDGISGQLVGGFKPVTYLEDCGFAEAAGYALYELEHSQQQQQQQYSFQLDKTCQPQIIAASQQVVAGINYKMIIVVRNHDTTDCMGAFLVTIYNDLGNFKVTEWGREYSCAEAKVILESGRVGVEDWE